MKKIGILGGTFNPHSRRTFEYCKMCQRFSFPVEVWFLRAGTPPHKDVAEHVSAWHRKNMVNSAIASERAFLLCDIELEKKTPCYSGRPWKNYMRSMVKAMVFILSWRRSFAIVCTMGASGGASVPVCKIVRRQTSTG